MSDPLDFLRQRVSAVSRQLGEPAPSPAELRQLLEASIRVPDHGKLVPFRLLSLSGADKARFGERLAERAIARDPHLSEAKREKERQRYDFAPLVLIVITRIDPHSSVPALEQQLSAGCVAYNLLLGAQALGYGAQWLTGWAAYDKTVAELLCLTEREHIVGFVHIGTARSATPDRERPVLDQVFSAWTA